MKGFTSIVALCLVLLSSSIALGQQYHLVEFEPFTPPIQAIKAEITHKTIKNFVAADMSGKSINLHTWKGKKILMAIVNNEDETSKKWAAKLVAMADKKHEVMLLYENAKSELSTIDLTNPWCTIVPNASFIGEMIYEKDLGTPRLFVIDDKLVVNLVLSRDDLLQAAPSESYIDQYFLK